MELKSSEGGPPLVENVERVIMSAVQLRRALERFSREVFKANSKVGPVQDAALDFLSRELYKANPKVWESSHDIALEFYSREVSKANFKAWGPAHDIVLEFLSREVSKADFKVGGTARKAALELVSKANSRLKTFERLPAKVRNNPTNLNGSLYIKEMVATKVWRNGVILRVGFLNGSDHEHSMVKKYVRHFERYANIRFEFGSNDSLPEIQIRFGAGTSYSYLGTDATASLDCPGELTMHLNLNQSPETARMIVLHELAHMCSLVHEHQRHCSPIRLHLQRCRASYGLSWEGFKLNLCRRPKQWTPLDDPFAFDEKSITIYPFVADALRNARRGIPVPTCLSEKDQALLAYTYPKPCGGKLSLSRHPYGLPMIFCRLYERLLFWLNGIFKTRVIKPPSSLQTDHTERGHQEFEAFHKVIPAVIPAFKSLSWYPESSSSQSIEIIPPHDGRGFDYTYHMKGYHMSLQPLLSYLPIDPFVKGVHFGEELFLDTIVSDFAARSLQEYDSQGLTTVPWIRKISIDGNCASGSLKFVLERCWQGRSPIQVKGGIHDVVYNWLTLSRDAINIFGGRICWSPGISSQPQLIRVPKAVFPEWPKIVSGVSGLDYTRFGQEHAVSILVDFVPEDSQNDSNMDEEDSSDIKEGATMGHWTFKLRVKTCHPSCFRALEVGWVAVSRGNGRLMRPLSKEAMEKIARSLDEECEKERKEIEKMDRLIALKSKPEELNS